MQSSKLTNILLAVIAIGLLAIAFRPANFVPYASAQTAGSSEATDLERISGLTTTSKQAQQQAEATRAIATAIEGLAKSTENIAKAIENLARAVTDVGMRLGEGQAGAAAAAGAATPAAR